MAQLYGRSVKPGRLEKHVGRIDQVAGARLFSFEDGPARGMRGIDVWTGSGLEFTVLPDRGLDIGGARINGRALAWESSTGHVSPERYDPQGFRWLRSFQGGLLTTCGLRHFGAPDADPNGESWGLHGRASNLSAEDLAIDRGWEDDEYRIRIRGRMAESEVFKPTIVLERMITATLGSSTISVADRVTNVGFEPSPVMLLYHCNLGWPLLSAKSRLLVEYSSIKPVTDHAAAALASHREMLPPKAGVEELVYTMVPKAGRDGLCRAALVNPDLDGGTALEIAWPKKTLPYVMEWKMPGTQEYVLGLEPANCPFPPREKLRERGLMPMLGAGQSFEAGVSFRIGLGTGAIRDIERRVLGGSGRAARPGKGRK